MPSKRMRFNIFNRDNFTCQYCGRKAPDVILELDHIIPQAEGGQDCVSNLITSCFECNRGKQATKLFQLPFVNNNLLSDNTRQKPLYRNSIFSKEEWLQLSKKFGGWHSAIEMKYILRHPETWERKYTRVWQILRSK